MIIIIIISMQPIRDVNEFSFSSLISLMLSVFIHNIREVIMLYSLP